MSEKMIEIKDRQISERTIVEALKAYCGFEEFDESKAPVFSTVRDCLVIKLTEGVKDSFKTALDNSAYLALESDGTWEWGFDENDTFQNVTEHFGDAPKPVFSE